jgi:hypothetical protein
LKSKPRKEQTGINRDSRWIPYGGTSHGGISQEINIFIISARRISVLCPETSRLVVLSQLHNKIPNHLIYLEIAYNISSECPFFLQNIYIHYMMLPVDGNKVPVDWKEPVSSALALLSLVPRAEPVHILHVYDIPKLK